MATADIADAVAQQAIDLILDADRETPHLAVRTQGGYTVLRERAR